MYDSEEERERAIDELVNYNETTGGTHNYDTVPTEHNIETENERVLRRMITNVVDTSIQNILTPYRRMDRMNRRFDEFPATSRRRIPPPVEPVPDHTPTGLGPDEQKKQDAEKDELARLHIEFNHVENYRRYVSDWEDDYNNSLTNDNPAQARQFLNQTSQELYDRWQRFDTYGVDYDPRGTRAPFYYNRRAEEERRQRARGQVNLNNVYVNGMFHRRPRAL